MNITTLAIDIAKNIFQLHGNDKSGKCIYKRRITRSNLFAVILNMQVDTIVMESCAGSSYLHREFTKLGYKVKLIAPQYVKPFVKTNKNDANDAEAIAEASSRPNMRYVEPKTIEQQDIQSIHRIRTRLVSNRTQLSNQIKGLLLEYGIAINQSYRKLREIIVVIIDNETDDLSTVTKELLLDLYNEMVSLEEKIKAYDLKVANIVKTNEKSKLLSGIDGVGNLSATAIISVMKDPSYFKNGRHFAAYLGLVPKQHSSGGKSNLLGISKRGNVYLRTLLVHGARSVIANSSGKTDKRSLWIQNKLRVSGYCKTAIAIANKNARIAWSMLMHNTKYDINFNHSI